MKYECINVIEYGADPTGVTDCTDLLTKLHATGKKIYYPDGEYLFNGTELDFSGGVVFESFEGVRVRNSISDIRVIEFDDFGNLIGLIHNHLEKNEYNDKPISGNLVDIPLSSHKSKSRIDLIPYWYNDFGLKCHLSVFASQATGWIGWHYWTWNQHDCEKIPQLIEFNKNCTTYTYIDPYDPARHPLQGFYRGDDPVVLDQQAYWMLEYGINTVSLLNQGINGLSGWETPSHRDHWLYQLFNNSANFKKMKYIMNGEYSKPPDEYSTSEHERVKGKFIELAEMIYTKYDNCYTICKNGMRYPVISILEETQYEQYMGSSDNVFEFYCELAEKFQSFGFGGFALFTREEISSFKSLRILMMMESKGILRYETSYVSNYVSTDFLREKDFTYRNLIDSFSPPSSDRAIISVATSLDTHTPHESNWHCADPSPDLFREYLNKAIRHLDKNPDMPQIIMCYNVSEWAEGGPGLIPNMKDRFGYLDAIRKELLD